MIYLKKRAEIDRMRETGRLVHKVIHETAKLIAPGVTTGEREDYAIRLISENGGSSPCLGYAPEGHPPYPAWTCISVNEQVVHGVPGRRVLQEGDIVGCDVGANVNGYYADGAWTFPVGRISPAAERLLRISEEALYVGIDKC